MAITPNAEQFTAYAESDLEGEVVMLNLLKYKRSASEGGGSGEDAYRRYSEEAIEMVKAQGGHVVWMGSPRHVFIGDVDENDWDAVALVSYPSRQHFLEMIGSSKYKDSHKHRESGLERTVLIACAPRVPAGAPAGAES